VFGVTKADGTALANVIFEVAATKCWTDPSGRRLVHRLFCSLGTHETLEVRRASCHDDDEAGKDGEGGKNGAGKKKAGEKAA